MNEDQVAKAHLEGKKHTSVQNTGKTVCFELY